MRRLVILVILLILVVGGLFYFNSQAEPLPLDTIETPVATEEGNDGDA